MRDWDETIKKYAIAENTFNHSTDDKIIDSAIYDRLALGARMENLKKIIEKEKEVKLVDIDTGLTKLLKAIRRMKA